MNNGINFESVAALIHCLGSPPLSPHDRTKGLSPGEIFSSWLAQFRRPFPPHTGKQLFRLLFPHEGSRRRYGLRETKLSLELEAVLGMRGLRQWDSVGGDRYGEGGTGCLGKEVELRVRERGDTSRVSTLGIAELDSLLDQLAAHCPFSQLSLELDRASSQTRILTRLYCESHLSSSALSVLTQIILRDLRPLLSPLPTLRIRNPTAMLRIKSTAGPPGLTLYETMRSWDVRMLDLYRGGRGDLDWCADAADQMAIGEVSKIPPGPILGINVPIPKCRKGRSIEDALGAFTAGHLPPDVVWAETKHDGYRMQIHVEILHDESPRLTIFSKSKRNSTLDRLNTHAIILAALDLPIPPGLPRHCCLSSKLAEEPACPRRVQRSVILEAEVVPYNEGRREGDRGPGVEEFWWLGVAGVTAGEEGDQFGLAKDRHLCLVFFDILHLDGRSLLDNSYGRRRGVLEEVIRVIPGFAQVVDRLSIPLHRGRLAALTALERAFTQSNQKHEEGLVLKSADSTYTGMLHPWVKLKKDYIPNLGDCVDLVILGAGWDIDRARDMRVDTSVCTTFHVGVLSNSEQVKARKETPHFEILFRASYGVSREQLEIYNEAIRHGRWSNRPFDRDDPFKMRLIGLSWTYAMPKGMPPPSVLFDHPLCGEFMGAGFQKLPNSRLYELRWPRLQKIFEPSERSWSEALDAAALMAAAHLSLGYAPPNPLASPENDSIRAAWRSSSIACLDIPDTPSPTFTPMKRAQSAPDLFEVHKVSPPTPRSGVGFHRVSPPPPRSGEGSYRVSPPMLRKSGVPSPTRMRGSSYALRRAMDSEIEDERSLGWLRTPVTSPQSKHHAYRTSLEKLRRLDTSTRETEYKSRWPGPPVTLPISAHTEHPSLEAETDSIAAALLPSSPPANGSLIFSPNWQYGSSRVSAAAVLHAWDVNSPPGVTGQHGTAARLKRTRHTRHSPLKPMSLRSRLKSASRRVKAI